MLQLLRKYERCDHEMLEILKWQDFDSVFMLLENSFPTDEYRTYDEHKALLYNDLYTIYALYDGIKLKAFISVWEFDKFAYVEHFAVTPEYRNGGLGSEMLRELRLKTNKKICLEVEPPESETARRRIAFYQRNGFYLNDYPYIQPPISKGKKAIPLLIMTSGGKADRVTLDMMKNTLYKKVYGLCGNA